MHHAPVGSTLRLFLSGLCTLFVVSASAQTDSAVLASAIKYGNEISQWFIAQKANDTISTGTTYYNALSWYGMLLFGKATSDTFYLDTIQKMYKKLLAKNPPLDTGMVDNNSHGILPLELYRETGYAPFLAAGKALADDEFSKKHLRPDTLSTYSRFWADDMYMIGSLQTQAWKNIDTGQYLNNCARTLAKYADSNQQPNGLFWHSTGTPKAPYFWGRANGWAASSMAELLQVLPATHPLQPKIMAAYQRQMSGLLQFQDSTGMWHQLIDTPSTNRETSCTGMFVFAIATGLREGWLVGSAYKSAAEKAWTVLTTYYDTVNGLKDVCPGFGANASASAYVNEALVTGDPHGTLSFLWGATGIDLLLSKSITGIRVPGNTASPTKELLKNGHVDNRIFDIRGRYIGTMSRSGIDRVSAWGCYICNGRLALQLRQ